MFSALAEKFQGIFRKFLKDKSLTEENIQEAFDEVRLALLDADVQYGVVKTFIKRVKEKALGQELLSSVSPGQLFIKIVHDELVSLFGNEEKDFVFQGHPAKMILCGLQGSGKTTQAAKLASFLKKKKGFQRICLVACDLARPAAQEQLQTLAEQAGVFSFTLPSEKNPIRVAEEALKKAREESWEAIIFDTAGRLHIDEELMKELKEIKDLVRPHHTLLAMNAATGQDAVKTAASFAENIGITGSILTMLDGSSKGGAAISLVEVTKQPIFFEGHGEKIEDIRPFHPVSMADRILGMGDTINLVRVAQDHIQEEDSKSLEDKLRKAELSYADFLKQMQTMKKMGSLKGLLSMVPGLGSLKDIDVNDREMVRTEAIILSMTPSERQGEDDLSMSRRKRIAKGSGTSFDDVNQLVKKFKQTKQLFKGNVMKNLEKSMRGKVWH
jgi:signal recognition particle subunit SRP54